MAYYYVKSGGTAGNTNAGRTTTPRTGAWSGSTGDYYDNIHEVFGIDAGTGTLPADGDYIFVPHDASETMASNIGSGAVENNNIINLVSVDSANQENFRAGYTVDMSGSLKRIYPRLHVVGCNLNWGTATAILFHNRFSMEGGQISAQYLWSLDGSISLKGVAVTLGNQGIRYFHRSEIIGGSISSSTAAGVIYDESIAHFNSSRLEGVDLTGFTSASYVLKLGTGHESSAEVKMCKLPASVPLLDGDDLLYENASVLIANSGATSAEQEYQWFFKDWAGETEHNTSNYRDDTTAFPVSSQKISLVTDTTTQAVADIGRVHSFDFFTRYARLSNSDYDTITIYLSCDDALTDSEVWVDVYYPDGTNRHQPNKVSTRASNILGSGTALTSDSSTWTGGGTNKYKIVISTSSDPGGDCVPTIKVNVATQSLIYWDPVPELS